MHGPLKSRRSFSVLIVEDEFLIAMEIAAVLEDNGHSVAGSVASVEEALKLLETLRPDVAVLDVNLRGQLVIPVAERLRSLDIPFVLCSAYSSPDINGGEVLTTAPNVGKPFSETLLLEALARAIV